MADKPYSVGDLEVKISAIGGGALNTLDTVIAKMTSLSSIVKSVTTADLKWISSFNTRVKTLSKNMGNIDWDTVEAGFNRLTTAITPFLNKITTAETSLKSLNEMLSRVSSKKLSTLEMFSSNKRGGSSTANRLFSYGKIMGTYYLMRRLGGAVADIVQYGVDYTEVLNLWQVAMRDNLSMATQFVDKMSKAYGISQKTLMQAQATFRNMIGSLGDLSDMTSYALSEAITQMAIDYASLYNAPIDEAINKFQSALAGQVRPIRSISGYDITEKTIHALYQALGGTKTQRQLSRTEKQLLAIYAIFNQMGKSGALGDMTKTLGNFANQSRMMAENWKELSTWIGTTITHLMQQSAVMVKINAGLIFASELAKEIAYTLGYETPNFAAGWESSVDGTITAVEELQGKLLGFDKIRALQTEEESISIDEKLLQAISGYSSLIDQADNSARSLAESWKEITFWQDGVFQEDKAKEFFDDLKAGVKLLGTLSLALKFSSGKAFLLGSALKDAFSLKGLGLSLLVTSFIELYATSEDFRISVSSLWDKLSDPLFALIDAGAGVLETITPIIAKVVELADKLGLLEPLIVALIAISISKKILALGGGIVALSTKIGGLLKVVKNIALPLDRFGSLATNHLNPALGATTQSFTWLNAAISATTGALAYFASDMLLSNIGDEARSIVAPIMAAVGAVTALTMAFLALQGTLTLGTALPIITASIGAAVAGVKAMINVDKYANGGTPDKGTLFIAGEAGAEIVSTSSNGQTGVSNVQQIEQAMYNALVRYGSAYSQGDERIVVQVGDDEVFNATRKAARRRGFDFSRR